MTDQQERDTPDAPTNRPEPTDEPADTSTDWDEWMRRHGPRPRPRADVADDQGKFPEVM